MTTYLVTGATGFIGRRVVQALLEREATTEVHVLTRPSSQERLTEAMRAWPNTVKVRTVHGDLGEPALGVDPATVEELRGAIDHVVHLAALYDMTAGDEENERANVDGTRHLLELAARVEAGRVHHVSSIAVAGDYRGKFTEDMFDVGQSLPSPYHRTKFEAERLVRAQSDVPWRVYRPAIVVGDSKTGEMDKIDGIYHVFPSIAALARLPEFPLVAPELGNTNVVPVDYVANAMVYLMHEPGLDRRAFHLVNPKPQPLVEVYNCFADAAGAPRVTVRVGGSIAATARGLARLAERLPGAGLVRDTVLGQLDIPPEVVDFAELPTVFDTVATREALRGSGLEVPRLTDYAGVLWRYWRSNLDPARARRHGPRGELDGRRVVVTGASSGIGRATARKLADEGATALLIARREEELEQVRREILAAGGHAWVYPCDLTDPDAVDKTVRQMFAEHDGIEMLVNNAGRSIRRSVALSYDRFHDYERAMAINYFGAVRLILALLPHMTERRFGHIVNVSSIGVQGIAPRFSAYVASKAALDYFSRIVATETRGQGVTFTTVHMPLVRTPMIRPTTIYDAFPAMSPDAAADMIITALKKRPKQIGTPYGAALGTAYTLAPGIVDAVAHQGYRLFPESAAARGGEREPDPQGRRVTQLAATLMKLTRGFHW